MSQAKPVLTEVEQLHTTKEVASLLSCHENSVYQMIRQREMHAIRMRGKRGKWLIPHSSVLAWMNRNLQPAKGA